MALNIPNIQILIFSLILGGLIGNLLEIEEKILKFGEYLKRIMHLNEKGATFAKGFLDAPVLFCIGPMTVVGSLEAGLCLFNIYLQKHFRWF